jgi:hypothetical protein
MSPVKRYYAETMDENAYGAFVLHDDYDALAQQLAARDARLQEILNEVSAMEKRQAALQGLLNERDQQVDDAVGLLREWDGMWNGGGIHNGPLTTLRRKTATFLLPAEDKANDH